MDIKERIVEEVKSVLPKTKLMFERIREDILYMRFGYAEGDEEEVKEIRRKLLDEKFKPWNLTVFSDVRDGGEMYYNEGYIGIPLVSIEILGIKY